MVFVGFPLEDLKDDIGFQLLIITLAAAFGPHLFTLPLKIHFIISQIEQCLKKGEGISCNFR